ncbi:MAG: tetratricopeptide repeat protein [Ignavibacteriae bacterium]|nr:tetratricopeptide repeat protein [Ignavibacteriota bacterium]
MKQYIILFTTFILLQSCSSNVDQVSSGEIKKQNKKIAKQKEFAQQLFIDASLLDMEEKYAEAILDYQEALKLDPSAGIHYALGKDYLRLNKINPALEHARKATELEGNNIEYQTLVGTIYSFNRNIDSAETVFARIIELDSTAVNAYYNLAQLYETKKPLEALKFYDKILDLTGPEWNVLLKIAGLNERLGKVEETVKTVEELLELNPSNLQLQKLLIESYVKNEKYEEAITMVNNSLEIFPDDLNLIELKGNALIQQEKWSEGAAEYDKIISKPKIPFETKMKIGAAFFSEAMQDSNVISYAENILLQIDKDSSDWQINAYLGELANASNDDSLTVKYFKKSIKLANWNVDLWIRLGQLLFEGGDYTSSIIEMEKAVVKFPKNYVINLILGLSNAQNSNHEEALSNLKKANELNPNELNAILAYSFSLNQLKRDDEALTYLERALRVDPKNLQALSMMGLIYDSKKMFVKSDSIYHKAVSLDSSNVLLLNNFAYSLAERGIDLERALKMVQVAVDEEPENSSYLDTIGWVYFQMGDYENAKNYIDKAIIHDEGNATLLDHLGDVHYKLDDKIKAKEIWQNAFELDSTKSDIQLKINEGLK